MKIKLFSPNDKLVEIFGATCLSYVYDTGINIVREFGNVFVVRLAPRIHYLILSRGGDLNLDGAFICSNKYDYEKHPNLEEKYIRKDSFRDMCGDKYLGGLPSNIHGRKVLLSFPYGNKLPFVFDVESEEYLPIIPYEYKNVEELAPYFEKQESIFGDCSDMFIHAVKPELQPLNTYPCGEYAGIYDTKYLIGFGWQIRKYLSDKIQMKSPSSSVKYLIIQMSKDMPNMYIYSNKWSYDSHSKVEDWMKEPGAHEKMFSSVDYSGLPCNLNGHRVIVCYPFQVYNPTIWDIDTDEVFVLPSRAYPGDAYYDSLVAKYGNIY